LTFVLDGKINQRRGPAKRSRARAGLEIVGARGAAKGHIKVGVHVDSAGKDIFAASIDYFSGVLPWKTFSDGGDFSIIDCDVARVSVGRGHYATVNDDGVEAHDGVFSFGGEVQILC
jgi:hypothetical protein